MKHKTMIKIVIPTMSGFHNLAWFKNGLVFFYTHPE